METLRKHENHDLGHKITVNRPGNPELWAITLENSNKMRIRRVIGYISQTRNESYEPFKSAWNPKTVGDNS